MPSSCQSPRVFTEPIPVVVIVLDIPDTKCNQEHLPAEVMVIVAPLCNATVCPGSNSPVLERSFIQPLVGIATPAVRGVFDTEFQTRSTSPDADGEVAPLDPILPNAGTTPVDALNGNSHRVVPSTRNSPTNEVDKTIFPCTAVFLPQRESEFTVYVPPLMLTASPFNLTEAAGSSWLTVVVTVITAI